MVEHDSESHFEIRVTVHDSDLERQVRPKRPLSSRNDEAATIGALADVQQATASCDFRATPGQQSFSPAALREAYSCRRPQEEHTASFRGPSARPRPETEPAGARCCVRKKLFFPL